MPHGVELKTMEQPCTSSVICTMCIQRSLTQEALENFRNGNMLLMELQLNNFEIGFDLTYSIII